MAGRKDTEVIQTEDRIQLCRLGCCGVSGVRSCWGIVTDAAALLLENWILLCSWVIQENGGGSQRVAAREDNTEVAAAGLPLCVVPLVCPLALPHLVERLLPVAHGVVHAGHGTLEDAVEGAEPAVAALL